MPVRMEKPDTSIRAFLKFKRMARKFGKKKPSLTANLGREYQKWKVAQEKMYEKMRQPFHSSTSRKSTPTRSTKAMTRSEMDSKSKSMNRPAAPIKSAKKPVKMEVKSAYGKGSRKGVSKTSYAKPQPKPKPSPKPTPKPSSKPVAKSSNTSRWAKGKSGAKPGYVQAEDQTWVPKSFYDKPAKPKAGRKPPGYYKR